MAREEHIIAQLRLTDAQLAGESRRRYIRLYRETIETRCRRQRIILVNDLMPDDLHQFNGPDFDYDESAQWVRGQILVVFKVANDPAVSYFESPQCVRLTDDQSISLLEDE